MNSRITGIEMRLCGIGGLVSVPDVIALRDFEVYLVAFPLVEA